MVFANNSFQLKALDENGDPMNSFTFSAPITVTLTYEDQDIAGIFEKTLFLYYWDTVSSSWKDASTTCKPQSLYIHDVVNNTVTVDICHFTEFAFMGVQEYKVFLPVTTQH